MLFYITKTLPAITSCYQKLTKELSKIHFLKAPMHEEQLMVSGNFLRLTQKSRNQTRLRAA